MCRQSNLENLKCIEIRATGHVIHQTVSVCKVGSRDEELRWGNNHLTEAVSLVWLTYFFGMSPTSSFSTLLLRLAPEDSVLLLCFPHYRSDDTQLLWIKLHSNLLKTDRDARCWPNWLQVIIFWKSYLFKMVCYLILKLLYPTPSCRHRGYFN